MSYPVDCRGAYRYHFGTAIETHPARRVVTRAKRHVAEMWAPSHVSNGKAMVGNDGQWALGWNSNAKSADKSRQRPAVAMAVERCLS